MIPPFNHHGLLPPGCHTCQDWTEFANAFAFNAHREKMLQQAQRFVRDRLTPIACGLPLVIGGSFLTDKECPGDIDMVVLMPMHELGSRSPLLEMFIREGSKGAIWTQYKVEFYLSLEDSGGNNLALYFEYVGEKSAAAKGLAPKDKRGTIGIESWTLG